MISFIWTFQNRQIHRDRKWIGGCLGLQWMNQGIVGRGWWLMDSGFLFEVVKYSKIDWWCLHISGTVLKATELHFEWVLWYLLHDYILMTFQIVDEMSELISINYISLKFFRKGEKHRQLIGSGPQTVSSDWTKRPSMIQSSRPGECSVLIGHSRVPWRLERKDAFSVPPKLKNRAWRWWRGGGSLEENGGARPGGPATELSEHFRCQYIPLSSSKHQRS